MKRFRNQVDFANRPIENMVALGAVTASSFRLWMRARRPGAVTVRWSREGHSDAGCKRVRIAENNPGDNTVGGPAVLRGAPYQIRADDR